MTRRLDLRYLLLLFSSLAFCAAAALGIAMQEDGTLQMTGPSADGGGTPPAALTVYYLDVGQADAALLVSDGEAMLIDAGNNDDQGYVLTFLAQHGVDSLSCAVGTHAHEDHIGALDEVLLTVPTERLLLSPAPGDTKSYENVLSAAERAGVTVTRPGPGDTFSFGACDVTVLAPIGEWGVDYTDLNDSSLVMLVNCGETNFLFTGDMERTMELTVLDSFDLQHVDVLKVGHHGSDYSTCYPFLRALMPTYAVISVGAGNPYGHPGEELLSRLRDAGAVVLRTDQLGTVTVTSDGTYVTVV
ncbi:MAG: MBL fold metallo-hydrolase [Oscillospiraceae bacterium]|nr:MBL fold metallo-hydrolase [Oscillospiraceae bacterium]